MQEVEQRREQLPREPMRPTVNEKQDVLKNQGASLPLKQQLEVKIIGITGNKIQLQVFTNTPARTNPGKSAETGNKQSLVFSIERSQLQPPKAANATQDLKVGQRLTLEVTKTGAMPEFKMLPAANKVTAEKISELVKLFLPRHESSPVLLNQLIKDLPQLMKNEGVPQALKRIAVEILQNLPRKEQLISSQGLKQSIANSGLTLEAKLAHIMDQPDKSAGSGFARAAPEGGRAGTARPELNLAEDFKANLLKFVQALKQEITHQSEQTSNEVDLGLFKNLQHKSENTLAKIVMDQLISLPREDSPKQLWNLDIPFFNKEKAETVKIEIQRDKKKNEQSACNNWSVNITIAPPELGTIHCIIIYQNDVISTYFKSRKSQTTDLINHNLDYLKGRLEESGLTTGHLNAHDGIQKTKTTHQINGKKLFDENV
jgi:flagellar hook-length control protein FliK